jgi:hypothetical protein
MKTAELLLGVARDVLNNISSNVNAFEEVFNAFVITVWLPCKKWHASLLIQIIFEIEYNFETLFLKVFPACFLRVVFYESFSH